MEEHYKIITFNRVFVDMNYRQVSNQELLATRINCGNGSQKAKAFNDNNCYLRALTTTYIQETVYSTPGNDSENSNNVKVQPNPHLLPKTFIGYSVMVSSSETKSAWG